MARSGRKMLLAGCVAIALALPSITAASAQTGGLQIDVDKLLKVTFCIGVMEQRSATIGQTLAGVPMPSQLQQDEVDRTAKIKRLQAYVIVMGMNVPVDILSLMKVARQNGVDAVQSCMVTVEQCVRSSCDQSNMSTCSSICNVATTPACKRQLSCNEVDVPF